MRASDAFGLLAQGVLAATALVAVAAGLSRGRIRAGTVGTVLAWCALASATCVVAVGGLSAASHLRGIVGDPSVTSVLLLALAVVRPGWLPHAPGPRTAAVLAALLGAFLYLPLVAGAPPFGFDLHATGWTPAVPLACLGAWMALAWIRGSGRWVALLAAALLAWGAGVVESDNVFDALVDPGVTVACAAVALRGVRISRRAAPT